MFYRITGFAGFTGFIRMNPVKIRSILLIELGLGTLIGLHNNFTILDINAET